MKVKEINILLLLLLSSFLFAGFTADALSYDYTASIECLKTPHKSQYGGGILVNPEFVHGLRGWSTFGDANVEARVSEEGGNKFIVARGRNRPYDSFSQEIYLHKDMLYTFSAWIQVSDGNVPVRAVFKTTTGFRHAGAVVAESGCWSMLKGGLTVDISGPSKLYFESNNTSVELWVDSISLQPFTKEQWRSHQVESIEKTRKGNVRLRAVDSKGDPLANAGIEIKWSGQQQNQLNFPFGCAMTKNILTNTAYQNWFTSRFKVTTFENEMKWYSTENTQGKEDYSVPDAMLQFAKQHGIAVRGHNVLWDDPSTQPGWVNSLSPTQLAAAAEKRISSILTHYKGQVIAWDVVNENLHFSFFESKLGSNASAAFYQRAHQLDSATPMFMNEYNTIEQSGDGSSSPAKYLQKLREIQSLSTNGQLAIGLEAHFDTPNLPYMRASIDTLAATKLPIWLTEVDVRGSPANQALYLEQVLREAHAHPVINGIVMWAAWSPQGCYRMCLTDNNFKNLPTGDVVDKLLREWGGQNGIGGTTDANGFFETSLFHGDYKVTISHLAAMNSSSTTQAFKVASTDSLPQTMLHVQVPA